MAMSDNVDKKERLLIVDDDETFTTVLARAMRKRGYQVEVANNIQQALQTALQQVPQIAIIDLNMAGESGLELLPQLKQANSAIKMLILTGYSSIATAVEAIKLGAVNYLCKPVDADEILAAFAVDNNAGIPTNVVMARPSVERLEWEHIQKVLSANNGNISATARSLNMHRRTLQRKLQKRPVKR